MPTGVVTWCDGGGGREGSGVMMPTGVVTWCDGEGGQGGEWGHDAYRGGHLV